MDSNNGRSCCVLFGSGVQTDATTPQQCWDLQCIVGRKQPIRLCKLEFESHPSSCEAPTMLKEPCKLM